MTWLEGFYFTQRRQENAKTPRICDLQLQVRTQRRLRRKTRPQSLYGGEAALCALNTLIELRVFAALRILATLREKWSSSAFFLMERECSLAMTAEAKRN